MKLKDRFRLLLKAGVGTLLIYYVLHSKMVDFNSLKATLLSPPSLIIALFFLGVSAACCALRWHRLVKVQGLSLSRKDVLELTMIGYFFNSFMPGSVGGDLIKAWYAAGQEPKRKTKAVFTVLVDRVIGLWIIVACAAATLLFNLSMIQNRTELRLLAYAIWAFTGGTALAGLLFFATARWEPSWLTATWNWVRRSQRLGNLLDSALIYRHHIPAIVYSLLLSSASILSNIVLYKTQGDALGIHMSLTQYFFIIPVALTVSAIPVLPGGLGVGQVAFFTLFKWAGMADPGQGGTLCTLIQVYTLLFNCTGAIFYLKFKKKPASLETVPEPQSSSVAAAKAAIKCQTLGDELSPLV